jgi:hypothetical protein
MERHVTGIKPESNVDGTAIRVYFKKIVVSR